MTDGERKYDEVWGSLNDLEEHLAAAIKSLREDDYNFLVVTQNENGNIQLFCGGKTNDPMIALDFVGSAVTGMSMIARHLRESVQDDLPDPPERFTI